MTIQLSYNDEHDDNDWGAKFYKIVDNVGLDNIFVCHTTITDISKIANKLSEKVMDNFWVTDLDITPRRSYEGIVAKTAEKLVGIFNNAITVDGRVASQFGEIMVSMGASRALEIIFSHISVPISELWKPKLSGNEGFDFHTVCPDNIINFGEAKFSSSNGQSPYGGISGESSGAGGQADGFIGETTHHKDGVHLVHLVEKDAMDNFNSDVFGVVLAFSLNGNNPLIVLKNAIQKVSTYENLKQAKNIYIVGISHAAT